MSQFYTALSFRCSFSYLSSILVLGDQVGKIGKSHQMHHQLFETWEFFFVFIFFIFSYMISLIRF